MKLPWTRFYTLNIDRLVDTPEVPVVEPTARSAGGSEDSGTEPRALANEAEEELEDLLAAADEADDGTADLAKPHAADEDKVATQSPISADELRAQFREIDVSHTPGGGLRIEASPRAAATLAALFEGMAGMLRQIDHASAATTEAEPNSEGSRRRKET
ncbi:MAG: hypothetical protein HKP27_08975 [Myxococcales bacterium]|nr:hypothetical protein [Myxococcales bacterium]